MQGRQRGPQRRRAGAAALPDAAGAGGVPARRLRQGLALQRGPREGALGPAPEGRGAAVPRRRPAGLL